jgi:ABC-type polysaccharide/polyol phosphate export permease
MDDRIPNYGIYLFVGMVFWMFFKESSNKGLKMFKSKLYLIESLPIPRYDFFIAASVSALIGFLFNLIAMFLIGIVFGVKFHLIGILLLPLFLLVFVTLGFGMSLILATTEIYLKDVQHIWELVLVIGFWFSPIVLRGSIYTDYVPYYDYLHPFAASINGARQSLLYGEVPELLPILCNLFFSTLILFIGWWLLSRYSHKASELL